MTTNKDIIKGLKRAYLSIKTDQDSIERNRIRVLAAYREAFPSQHKDLFFYFRPAVALIAVLFIFVSASGSLVVLAQNAQPGNQLYSLKRTTEKITLMLTPAGQQKVLRAEMVARRLKEVKGLMGQEKVYNSQNLEQASVELEKEIAALKTELKNQESPVVAASDSPVNDNQKIISAVTNQSIDLEKILSETKEAIRDNNIEMAVDKIGEVQIIFSGSEEEGETVNTQTEQPIENNNKEDQAEKEKENTSPVLPKDITNQESVKVIPIVPLAPADFKVDVEMDNQVK
jgi:hypothetical protein